MASPDLEGRIAYPKQCLKSKWEEKRMKKQGKEWMLAFYSKNKRKPFESFRQKNEIIHYHVFNLVSFVYLQSYQECYMVTH